MRNVFDSDTAPLDFKWPVVSGQPERYAAFGWFGLVAIVVMLGVFGFVFWLAALAAALAGLARGVFLVQREERRKQAASHLAPRRIDVRKLHQYAAKVNDEIYLGIGGLWTPRMARLAHRILQTDAAALMNRGENPRLESGALWVRKLTPKPAPIIIPGNFQAGHMLVLGATGGGKTRFLDMLVNQAVARREPVIVIDPKTDQSLRFLLKSSMEAVGRGDRYWQMLLSDPDSSCRINPIQHYFDPKDTADRIASVMPASREGVFHAFPTMALQRITENLDLCGIRSTFVNISHYIDHPKDLLIKALDAHLSPRMNNWEGEAAPYVRSVQGNDRVGDEMIAEAYGKFYTEKVHDRFPNAGIAGLINQAVHDRTHFGRMMTSLMPILSSLTSGYIGPMLSPDPSDESDRRPIADLQRIINQGGVLYIGTSGLANRTAGAFLSAIICADLAAAAAGRYQRHQYEDVSLAGQQPDKPVHLFVDEAVEVLNEPFLALLNKSRGANFRITLLTQTISDFEAVLGNKARAMQALGNVNNVVMFRARDTETLKYFETLTPKLTLTTMGLARNRSITKDGEIAEAFRLKKKGSHGYSWSINNEEISLVPPHLLTELPDLEYFAAMKSGELIHGLVPIVYKTETRTA